MSRDEILEQFSECWEGLDDPRSGNAVVHDFYELLLMALCAVLCGGQGAVDMALFARADAGPERTWRKTTLADHEGIGLWSSKKDVRANGKSCREIAVCQNNSHQGSRDWGIRGFRNVHGAGSMGEAHTGCGQVIRRTHYVLLTVLLAVGLAYANSFENGFHFDDFHTVVDNPATRSLKNIPRFFADATTFSVLPANRTYRPMVSASLALDYALGRGYTPVWFHVSTFVLFLALIVVLYQFYRLLLNKTETSTANEWLALFAAAWFGLHPAVAETVNYVIQRGDLYCTLGCVAALLLYARYPGLRRTGVYLAAYVLALLSKPPAAVFPFCC